MRHLPPFSHSCVCSFCLTFLHSSFHPRHFPHHLSRTLYSTGRVFGDHPVHLRLLDVGFPGVPENLAGIKMELEDGAYPMLRSVTICIAELDKAFTNADVAILTGGFPRKAGMERKDLIAKNAAIFGEQGEAIEKYAPAPAPAPAPARRSGLCNPPSMLRTVDALLLDLFRTPNRAVVFPGVYCFGFIF